MTRILTLALLAGCSARTSVATSFQLTPMETSECVWVVRNNSKFVESLIAVDAQGQNYLYLCCPSESGQEPRCLTPKWSYPRTISKSATPRLPTNRNPRPKNRSRPHLQFPVATLPHSKFSGGRADRPSRIRNKKGSNLVQSGVPLREPLEAIMTELIQYEGLVLTRCDRCGGRQWCAIEGAALCRRCCPAAVEVAQEEHVLHELLVKHGIGKSAASKTKNTCLKHRIGG